MPGPHAATQPWARTIGLVFPQARRSGVILATGRLPQEGAVRWEARRASQGGHRPPPPPHGPTILYGDFSSLSSSRQRFEMSSTTAGTSWSAISFPSSWPSIACAAASAAHPRRALGRPPTLRISPVCRLTISPKGSTSSGADIAPRQPRFKVRRPAPHSRPLHALSRRHGAQGEGFRAAAPPLPPHASPARRQTALPLTAGEEDARRPRGTRARLRFVLLTSGVFVFYLLYAWLQEALTREWKRDGIVLGWFLTLAQFIVYSALGGSYMAIASPKARKVPMSQFSAIAGGRAALWRGWAR